MWMLLLTTTLAAPTEADAQTPPSPPQRVHGDAFLSTGVVAGGMGFTLGVAGDARNRGWVVFGEAAAGGRTRGISGGFPQEPGIVMTTVGVALDAADPRSGLRFGGMIALDTAVVDAAERDCEGINGCRHYLWTDLADAPVGLSFAPAIGLRMEQGWSDGNRVVASVAIQDHRIYRVLLPGPRGEVTIHTASNWMVGTWLRRHGIGVRIGRVLGRPPDTQ